MITGPIAGPLLAEPNVGVVIGYNSPDPLVHRPSDWPSATASNEMSSTNNCGKPFWAVTSTARSPWGPLNEKSLGPGVSGVGLN